MSPQSSIYPTDDFHQFRDLATVIGLVPLLIACSTQWDNVKSLTQCIRLNLGCADICNITGRISTRRTGSDEEVIRRMLDTCAAACRLCGEKCEKHAKMHEHCRICAESCRRCMNACEEAGRSMVH